jgi:hypothetical protein
MSNVGVMTVPRMFHPVVPFRAYANCQRTLIRFANPGACAFRYYIDSQ